jgi:hypothetical protein
MEWCLIKRYVFITRYFVKHRDNFTDSPLTTLKSEQLEDREGDGTLILRLILGKLVVSVGGGRKWLRITSSGGLWY